MITAPILIADAVGDAQVRQLLHDFHGGGVHQVQCAAIIGFDEFITIREPIFLYFSARVIQEELELELDFGDGILLTCGIRGRRCGPQSRYLGAGRRAARMP